LDQRRRRIEVRLRTCDEYDFDSIMKYDSWAVVDKADDAHADWWVLRRHPPAEKEPLLQSGIRDVAKRRYLATDKAQLAELYVKGETNTPWIEAAAKAATAGRGATVKWNPGASQVLGKLAMRRRQRMQVGQRLEVKGLISYGTLRLTRDTFSQVGLWMGLLFLWRS
jgi:hypothetical protein